MLQMRAEGLSGRAIAVSQQMSRKSVTAVQDAADAAGVAWDEVAGQSEAEVYGRGPRGMGSMRVCSPNRIGGNIQWPRRPRILTPAQVAEVPCPAFKSEKSEQVPAGLSCAASRTEAPTRRSAPGRTPDRIDRKLRDVSATSHWVTQRHTHATDCGIIPVRTARRRAKSFSRTGRNFAWNRRWASV